MSRSVPQSLGRRLLLPLLAACAVGAPGAHAAPAWLEVHTIGDATLQTQTPAIAVGPDGTTITAHRGDPYATSPVLVSVHEPGGTWTAPIDVTDGAPGYDPALAVDTDGTQTIAWIGQGAGSGIYTRTRTRGGSWGPTQRLSGVGEKGCASLRLATGQAGDVTAVWTHREFGADAATIEVVGAARRGGTWTSPMAIEVPANDARDLDLVCGAAGSCTAAWTQLVGPRTQIRSSTLAAGATAWTTPATLASGASDLDSPQLAVDAAGTETAVWRRRSSPSHAIEASRRQPGGAWEPPVVLSDTAHSAFAPDVAVSPEGVATAVWQRASTLQQLASSTRPAGDGATWSTPQTLTSAGRNGFEARIAVDRTGTATVAWRYVEDPFISLDQQQIRAMRRTPDGTWSAPIELSAPQHEAYDPRVGVSADGDVVTAWRRAISPGFPMQVRVLDTAGPSFAAPGGLTVPSTAQIGVPVALSAAPVDAWGTAGPVRWEFGDGALAEGGSTSHAYAAAGTYEVTVSATDGQGNASRVVRSITVAGARAGEALGAATGGSGAASSAGSSPSAGAGAAPGAAGTATPLTVRRRTVTLDVTLTRRASSRRCPAPRTISLQLRARRSLPVQRRRLQLTARGAACRLTGTVTLTRRVGAGTRVRVRIAHRALRSTTLRATAK